MKKTDVIRQSATDAATGGASMARVALLPERQAKPTSARESARGVSDALSGRAPVPRVSVVVPTCGRRELLDRCLGALVAQDIGPDAYEVIVVDDRPSPVNRELVEQWAERAAENGLRLRYLPNPGPHGPAAARNRGWQAAAAPLIAFTDDDTVPDRGWLSAGVAACQAGVDAICGRVVMPLPESATDYERDAQHLETAEFVTANCFCRKSMIESIGGFDERFQMAWREDSDFHFLLLEHGARIVHARDALVVHPVRPASWGVSVSQQKKIAYDALLYKKHPRLYRERIRATARWDYYLIVASLIAALAGAIAGSVAVISAALVIWLLMTGRFCALRLRNTKKSLSHVAEMILTSAVIPPLAVYWRLVGAIRFRSALL